MEVFRMGYWERKSGTELPSPSLRFSAKLNAVQAATVLAGGIGKKYTAIFLQVAEDEGFTKYVLENSILIDDGNGGDKIVLECTEDHTRYSISRSECLNNNGRPTLKGVRAAFKSYFNSRRGL